jgi:hypothetical protein
MADVKGAWCRNPTPRALIRGGAAFLGFPRRSSATAGDREYHDKYADNN